MTIEERMDKLEKQNRHLRLGLFGLLALMVGALLIGATKGDTDILKTRQLDIVDINGKTKISLSGSEVGGLLTMESAGASITIFCSDAGGYVTTTSPKGTVSLVASEVFAGTVLKDDEKEVVALFSTAVDSTSDKAALAFFNGSSRGSRLGKTGLALFDSENKPRAFLAVIGDGLPVLSMNDSWGVKRNLIMCDESDRAGFYLFGPDGETGIEMVSTDSGSQYLACPQLKKVLACGVKRISRKG